MNGFFDFIKNNLSHVAPVLLAGAFGVVIIAERAKALLVTYALKNEEQFFDKISESVYSGKIKDAIAQCDRFPNSPVARVVKQGLLRAHQPDEMVEQGLQLEIGNATQAIQKRTSFLATIANVATLLGLFGTIAGLISSFEAVGHADPQQKSALLAAGISTAMNATMIGLAVAIPCMVAFSYLVNVSNKLVSDVEHGALRTIDILKQRYFLDEIDNHESHGSNGTTNGSQGLRAVSK